MFQSPRVSCLLLLAIVLAACSAGASIQNEAQSNYAEPRRNADGPYLLCPNDRLRVKVYSDEQLNDEYQINSSGYVSIPLVGQIKASGMTTRQFERRLAARMKGQLTSNAKSPEISVEIAAYAPFYIYGEVKKAGEYPFRPGLTVADAIAIAGGLTYRASEREIYLRPAGRTVEEVVTLDRPVRIFPGDNIRVAERIF